MKKKAIISIILILALSFTSFAEIISQPMQGRDEISEKPISSHPRLMFGKDDIIRIKNNLTHTQNELAYAEFSDFARRYKTGVLPESDTYNYDELTLKVLEANAFDYIINGNGQHGEWAYLGMTNFMNTLNYNPAEGKGTNYHDASHVLFIAAEVYDWCYNLMDDSEKLAFIEAGQRLMGLLDWGYPMNLERASMVSGAGSTTMLLVDLFSFAISTYDENPDLYNYLSAVIKQKNMPGRNYWYDSGRYMSGSSYGVLRAYSDAWLYWMTKNALNTNFHDDNFLKLADYTLYEYTFDGKYLREGDDNWHAVSQYNSNDYDDNGRFALLNITATLTQNKFYKQKVLTMLPTFAKDSFRYGYVAFTAVQFLFVNDTSLSGENLEGMPDTKFFGEPDGTMIAKTGWEEGNESPDAMAFMKIGGNQLYDHLHNDSGSFQLYYKGNLMQDMGIYARTDQSQYYGYNTSTVSHNSLLIYDPLEYMYPRSVLLKNSETGEYYDVNAGGQNYIVPVSGYYSYSAYNEKLYNRADVTSYGFGPDSDNPEYSYISGDITNSYSKDKADNVDRSMMFMPTGIEGAPAVFMVMDKITSDNKYMDKKFLFHCVSEPVISGNAITVSRGELSSDKYQGEITSQILYPKSFKIDSYGGVGSQWMVNGYNFTPHGYSNADTRLDFGWGRLEISSTEENETEYFLNVMYINDKGKYQSVQTAKLVEDDNFIGGKVLNKLTLFNKNDNKINKDFVIDVPDNDEVDIAVTGVESGNWNVYNNGTLICKVNVSEESGILYFNGNGGSYEIKNSGIPSPDIDISYHEGNYILNIDSSLYNEDASFEITISEGSEVIFTSLTNEYEIALPDNLPDNSVCSVEVTAFLGENKSDTSKFKLNTSFGGGEGTKDNPYKISSSGHFLNIGSYSDDYYILTDNLVITENYVPFSFNGDFNGNGKSIMINLSHPSAERVGLFSTLSETASVYDLKIHGKVIGYSYVGSVAGYSNASIINCVNYADVSASVSYVGGIAGYTKSFINSVRNCVNFGNVKTNAVSLDTYRYAGGITGYNESPVILCGNYGDIDSGNNAGGISGGSKGDIYGCYNHGKITSNKISGGIAGVITDTRLYKECYNNGMVTGVFAGGIIGYKDSPKNRILRCYNAGEVSTGIAILGGYSEESGALGELTDCYCLEGYGNADEGITVLSESQLMNSANFSFDFNDIWCYKDNGYLYPQLKYATEAEEIIKLPTPVYNEADFIAINENPYGSYVLMNDITLSDSYVPFAFAGEFDGGNNKINLNINTTGVANTGLFTYLYGSPTVKNLIIDGSVISNGKASDNHTRTGALAGSLGVADNKLSGPAVILNITNYADVTSNTGHSTGGIIGDAYYFINNREVSMDYCTNNGVIKSFGTYVGGILGIGDTSVSLKYCANYNTVSANASVGGICGGMYGKITYSFNSAKISASGSYASQGGIAGSTASASAVISDCYNTGEIIGTHTNGANNAGIAGIDLTGGVISRCYNIGYVSSGSAIIHTPKVPTEEKPAYTKVTDCYYLSDNLSSDIEGTKSLTEEQFRIEVSFNSFDFENEWIINSESGYSYPYLKKITGNVYNPNVIKTASDFINMDPEGTYKLGADIDLSETSYIPFEFSGILNGNGHTITVDINYPKSEKIGLFSVLNKGGYVNNLIIKGSIMGAVSVGSIAGITSGEISGCVNYANVSVPNDSSVKGQRCGGIAGDIYEYGSITDCKNYGLIKGRSSNIGGICGVNTKGRISSCVNFGEVSTYSGGGAYAGIAGNITNGTVEKSANFGYIDANGAAGGIVGVSAGTSYITNCYNAGYIFSDNGPCGGIYASSSSNKDTVSFCYNVGKVYAKSTDLSVSCAILGGSLNEDTKTTITDCYYLNTDSTQSALFGKALSQAQLNIAQSYGNFDFDNVWEMGKSGYYYPVIKGVVYNEDFCYNPFDVKAPVSYPLFTGDITLADLNKLSTVDKFNIIGKNALLIYGHVSAGVESFKLVECGVVMSSFDSNPTLNENTSVAKKSDLLNENFGIVFYGNLNENQLWNLRCYASYEYNGNIYTIYGDVVSQAPVTTKF